MTGLSEEQYAGWLALAASGIPMGEVCAAKDIADTVLFLAGPGAARLTGAVLPVDGGLSLSGAGDSRLMKQQMK